RRAAQALFRAPSPAAQHPPRAVLRPRRVVARPARVIAVVVPVLAPLPDVAVHVVQAEQVRPVRPHRGGVLLPVLEPRQLRRELRAEGVRVVTAAAPAGFPPPPPPRRAEGALRFLPRRPRRQPPAELADLEVRDVLDRQGAPVQVLDLLRPRAGRREVTGVVV